MPNIEIYFSYQNVIFSENGNNAVLESVYIRKARVNYSRSGNSAKVNSAYSGNSTLAFFATGEIRHC